MNPFGLFVSYQVIFFIKKLIYIPFLQVSKKIALSIKLNFNSKMACFFAHIVIIPADSNIQWKFIFSSIQKSAHTSVPCVIKALQLIRTLNLTWESTLSSVHTNVQCALKCSQLKQTLMFTWKFILENDLLNVIFVQSSGFKRHYAIHFLATLCRYNEKKI